MAGRVQGEVGAGAAAHRPVRRVAPAAPDREVARLAGGIGDRPAAQVERPVDVDVHVLYGAGEGQDRGAAESDVAEAIGGVGVIEGQGVTAAHASGDPRSLRAVA